MSRAESCYNISMRLAVAANTVSQLMGKVLGAGTAFIISLLLARHFGVAGYGDFIKVTTYVALFFLLADFGLNAIYLQRVKDPHAFPTLFGARLAGGLFLVFLSLAILSFLPRGESQGYTDVVRLGIILFSPAILFQAVITTANAVFQKHLRYDIAAIAIGIGSAVALGTLLLLLQVPVNAPVTGSLALLGGSIVTAAVALFGVKRLGQTITVSFSPARTLPLFFAALPLGLTLLFNLVYGHVDSVILTLTRDTREVGIYGLAYKVFEVVLVFPTFFMNAVYPVLLRTINNKQEAIHNGFTGIIKKSFIFLLIVSCLLSVVLWFGAPLLANVQEGFAGSIGALRVLSLSLPFFFVSALVMWTLIALGKQNILVVVYGSTMVLNIGFNAWLIPVFGYMAAAWITVAGEGIVLLLSAAV
ncbi:MAG: Polysaccharide biosynthesis protein [Microgenomates group bacterium GW2011_GWA2_47_8]|nr:MAG: Polysaccharide biosynthesis protein [Microgenomates group bacterium GW2011_GWA2_47_8]